MATVVKKQNVASAPTKKIQLTGDHLIAFISGTQTNIGKSTFYNLKEEQQQALTDQHTPILDQTRPFYTLMSLSQGINDVNKQLIAWNLVKNTIREKDLKAHEHSPMTKWENEVILQTLSNMQPNRVMDFIVNLKNERIKKSRAMFLVYQWLTNNKKSWSLWAIKYRKDMKNILKHIRHNYNKAFADQGLTKIWNYLRYDKSESCDQIIQDYIAVQKGDEKKLAKLPHSVAEGFKKKFNLTDEKFEELFKTEGGKFSAKEARMTSSAVKRAGGETGLDIRKLELFDLLVYLKSQETLPDSISNLSKLIDQKAKSIADKMLFKFKNVGLILDTSISMFGSQQQPFHPMLRAMAISNVIRNCSESFKEYKTTESNGLFPKLSNQSNYADTIKDALKAGHDTIIIVGDGYENAPFEGAAHELLFMYKKHLDKENKLKIFHFNPIFASEAMDVRSLSSLVPQIGVREIKALNESLFLAVAKQRPMIAVQGYMKHLISLQNEKAKALMPEEVKKLANSKEQFLLT